VTEATDWGSKPAPSESERRNIRQIKRARREDALKRVTPAEAQRLGLDLAAGSDHYRAWVGPPATYDLVGALQFTALTDLGLREYHYLCEVGCGSLRAGRLFIPYLLDRHYCGIEPNRKVLRQGLRQHFGGHGPDSDIMKKKKPRFRYGTNFDIAAFGVDFDFILAQSVISHTGPAETSLFFQQCARAMGSTSIVLFTFIRGSENCTEDGWFYPKCVKYTTAYMRQLARDNGLDLQVIEWPALNRNEPGLVSGQTPALLRKARSRPQERPQPRMTTRPPIAVGVRASAMGKAR
jgi:hypothetical protein